MEPSPTTHRIELSTRTLVLVPCVIALCFVALQLLPVLLVLIVALMLVGTMNPALEWLERMKMNRTLAVVLLYVLVALAIVGLLVVTLAPLIAQVQSVIQHEPELRGRLADMLGKSDSTKQLAERLRHVEYGALAESSAPQLLTAGTRMVEIVAFVVSAYFLALYVAIDRDRLRGGVFALTPRAYHVRLSRILLNLESIVGGYIRGQALTCAFAAAFTWLVLTLCSVPNALALAMFAGVADLLPYVGGILAIGPGALAASSQGLPSVLIVAGSLFAYQEFESRFIVPRVYGQVLRLPSSIVLISLLAGGTLMGIPGALLALPTAAALRMLMLASRVALPGDCVDDERIRARDEHAEQEYAERARGAPADQAAAIAVELSEQRIRQEGELALEVPMTSGRTR
jgi:putative heme transporter